MNRFLIPRASVSTSFRFLSTSMFHLSQIVPFNLADIGEGVLKVDVIESCVNVGDRVASFEKLFVVQSDKATVDIESRYDGIIKHVHVSEGSVAYVGKPLVDIEVEGDAPMESGKTSESSSKEVQKDTTTTAETPPSATPSKKVFAAPAVRRLAREQNVDISVIPATGKHGHVTKEDFVKYMKTASKTQTPVVATAPAPTITSDLGDTNVPLSPVQRAMTVSMTQALTIPAFGAMEEIDMDALIGARSKLKKALAEINPTVRLTFMPLFLKAVSVALQCYPMINAHFTGGSDHVVHKGSHNIGFAMDSPTGLVVPVIRNVQAKSIVEIAQDIQALVVKGTEGKLSRADMSDGTFTISNVGAIGGTYTSPVILSPQVAIGAIGRTRKVPRLVEDELQNVSVMNVSWSADHRVIDGATMLRFSNKFKQLLENPNHFLLYLH